MDIEQLFSEEDLGAKLVGQFDTVNKDSIVPAMICWLFFGRSFENMVERGKEIMNNPKINRFQSFIIARSTKLIIKKSIALELRTREEWEEYNNFRKVIDSNQVMDWALDKESSDGSNDTERKKPGRKKVEKPLFNMLSAHVPDKELLLSRIGQYLLTKHSEVDLAYLKIALEELSYLAQIYDVKSFRDALELQYGATVSIVGERGVQRATKILNSYVSGKGAFVKDMSEDHVAIEELKTYLT